MPVEKKKKKLLLEKPIQVTASAGVRRYLCLGSHAVNEYTHAEKFVVNLWNNQESQNVGL